MFFPFWEVMAGKLSPLFEPSINGNFYWIFSVDGVEIPSSLSGQRPL